MLVLELQVDEDVIGSVDKTERIEYSVGKDKRIILPGCGPESKWEAPDQIKNQLIHRNGKYNCITV